MTPEILYPLAILGGMALIISTVIVSFDHLLQRRNREPTLVERINDLLPQTQCAQCNYPGCRPYAEAIVQGKSLDLCVPGGSRTQHALAKLLDRPIGAQLLPDVEPPVARIREPECIGCNLCAEICPVDAIVGAPQFLYTILEDLCTGCELCVPPCPVNCIDLIELDSA